MAGKENTMYMIRHSPRTWKGGGLIEIIFADKKGAEDWIKSNSENSNEESELKVVRVDVQGES